MDATIILTGIGTVVAIVASNIALISWLRADMKTFEVEIRASMKDFHTEIRGFKDEIQKESRDFHARLCVIEETRLSYMQPQPCISVPQEEKKATKKGKAE